MNSLTDNQKADAKSSRNKNQKERRQQQAKEMKIMQEKIQNLRILVALMMTAGRLKAKRYSEDNWLRTNDNFDYYHPNEDDDMLNFTSCVQGIKEFLKEHKYDYYQRGINPEPIDIEGQYIDDQESDNSN